MDNFSLETIQNAKVQADLVDAKKDNTVLMGKISFLEQENTILKNEITTLKGQNENVLEKISGLENGNTVLTGEVGNLKSENAHLKGILGTLKKTLNDADSIVDKIENGLETSKSTVLSKEGEPQSTNDRETEGTNKPEPVGANEEELSDSVSRQCSDEQEYDVAGGSNEPMGTNEEIDSSVGSQIGRRPKMQRKREQNETFRNWRKTMKQRNTSEDLWASGLLKVTIELWEDEGIYMDADQILDFIRRNVDQFMPYLSLEESKTRFFLTIIKMCSIRKVSKQNFEEIMLSFVNQGARNNRITEPEVRKFMEMYKE